MQPRFAGRAKSLAGTALNGLGILVFYENLHQAAIQFGHLLDLIPREALGALPALILTASQVLQTYGADYPRSLQGCLLHILVSFWPLLLVIAGTALSRDCSKGNDDAIPKKDCGRVDLSSGRSTSE